MQIVALRNGAQEDVTIVRMKMATLQSLRARYPSEFREFVLRVRDSDAGLMGAMQIRVHELPTGALQLLTQKGVMAEDGTVVRAMFNVVLSAAQVNGSEVSLEPPYQF
jgi:hypothetical protein